MTLIVEDGTGKSDAESYTSVADADTYHANRGAAAWAALSTSAKEQSLRKATDYMIQAYRMRWAGVRVKATQALDFPRYNVPMIDSPGGIGGLPAYYLPTDVPLAVQQACAALALKASTADLAPDLSQAVKSKTVGQLSIVYQDYSQATKTYRAIDGLLASLMANAGGVRVLRA